MSAQSVGGRGTHRRATRQPRATNHEGGPYRVKRLPRAKTNRDAARPAASLRATRCGLSRTSLRSLSCEQCPFRTRQLIMEQDGTRRLCATNSGRRPTTPDVLYASAGTSASWWRAGCDRWDLVAIGWRVGHRMFERARSSVCSAPQTHLTSRRGRNHHSPSRDLVNAGGQRRDHHPRKGMLPFAAERELVPRQSVTSTCRAQRIYS